MKWITASVATLTIIIFIGSSPFITFSQENPPTIEVYFSPHGGATEAIIKELNKAKSTVLVQAYTFTSAGK
jgi:hypothetical protein